MEPPTPRPPGCPHCGRRPCPAAGRSARTAGATWPRCAGWPSPRRPRRRAAPPRAAAALHRPAALPVIAALGLPALPWRAARAARAGPDPLARPARSLGTLVPLLWATAAVALLAAGAEAWRYVLLLASRNEALSADAVAASDALVAAAGSVAPVLAVLAGAAAGAVVGAGQAGRRRAGRRAAVAVAAGARARLGRARAEPHGPGLGAGRDRAHRAGPAADRRPRPSRLLLVWWALWVAGSCWPPSCCSGRCAAGCRRGPTGWCCTPCSTCWPRSPPG